MRILDFFRRIRGVSTPFGGISSGEKAVDKNLDNALCIGFDLNLLQGLGMMNAGSEDIEAYNNKRVILDERLKRAGFSFDLPISVAEMSVDEVAASFKHLNNDILVRFKAVKKSYSLPFLTGCWLADTLSAAAAAQIANPSQITQLFSAVIGRFEQAKLGAKALGASPAIMKDLSALRDRLLSLSKEAQVTAEQYGVVSEESLQLLRHLTGS
jgi:hypothetical protein